MTAFVYDDGGRKAAGYVGQTGDCVVRAIAIVTGLPYKQVYEGINAIAKTEKRRGKKSNARTGVYRSTYEKYLRQLGYQWVATMGIGTGCTVHLTASELPSGRLIVRTSQHLTAVLDGVIHDTHNPARNGKRCVYGYFVKAVA